ncbi:hypothetical protein [Petrocella sp. FN5]|uniref:hypothetical protein n=1 Tax=Petrocella sp. FN5 TaxID=3032002 RepID=UPI0023D99B84|nr:hypothetical protein [Petrocella sp. FN5]MDF1616895.1 hypothetical protein [Petrocella sp. FN5]
MIRIGLIGVITKEKDYLGLYLGKVLSMEHKVVLVTKHQSLMGALEDYEHNEYFRIVNQIPDVLEADYLIVNGVDVDRESYDRLFFITGPRQSEVTDNEPIFNKGILENDCVIYHNILVDSRINGKYLNNRFKIDPNKIKVLERPFNEWDWIMELENDYDLSIWMGHMSHDYQKLIQRMIQHIMGSKDKAIKKWLNKSKRSK